MAEEFVREGLPNNSGSEKEIIEYYFHRGFQYKNIVLLLEKYHGIRLSERTLKRKLKDFGLKRREPVDENIERRVRNIIMEELSAGPDRLNGYHSMWHILRLRHHMNVPRQLVASIMKEVDPEGVQLRKRRRLHRRTYVCPGPNFAWHVDGYDKLKPYGFSIHGCIDGFSRRLLWLQVQRSNKKPKVIARYFYDYVKTTGGCPICLLTNRGTENGLIAAMQCYLRASGQDEFAGSKAYQYLSSPRNQRIECYWSSLRKLRSSWWIDFFADLLQSGILDLTNDINKEALWFCFADVLQRDLDKARQHWNSHRIRRSHETTVPGIPDILYFIPEQSGEDREDCLVQVLPCKLEEVEQEILGGSTKEEIDEVWEEYFHYVMENNRLTYPATIFEAGELFQSLVGFAAGVPEAN